MSRIKTLTLVIVLTISCVVSSCNNIDTVSNRKSDSSDLKTSDKNTEFIIYDGKNQEIGKLYAFSHSILVDNSILYTKALEEGDSTEIIEYRLYNIETKEDHPLTRIYDYSYDNAHNAIIVGDKMYMCVTTGTLTERKKRKQTLYELNMKTFEMIAVMEIEGGFPYNTFTLVGNDTIVFAEMLDNGGTDLIKLKITDSPKDVPVIHKYDEDKMFTNDSIRHMYCDGKFVYIVRLKLDKKERYPLFLDTYDLDFRLIQSIDISKICETNDKLTAQYGDIENERKQWIAHFFVKDEIIFLKNISLISNIGLIKNENLFPLIKTDERFDYVSSAQTPIGMELFYLGFGTDENDKTNRNTFYLVDTSNGNVKKSQFFISDEKYFFVSASRNNKGKILLTMGRMPNEKNGARFPEKLYYLDVSELDFK